jgi:hypothetical protein
MAADSEKNKRTLTVLGYMGKFFFYGGTLAMIVSHILSRMSVMDGMTSIIPIPVMVFGFAMAWGAGNARAIVELEERVAALEERDRSS